jgi:type II secretory pathway pseudopilin PulG
MRAGRALGLSLCVLLVSVAGSLMSMRAIDCHSGRARLSAARIDLSHLSQALALYRTRTGAVPSTSEGLHALTLGSQRTLEVVPNDPWGHAYRYAARADGRWTLHSTGYDGTDQAGGGDDVIGEEKEYAGCEAYGIGCPITAGDVLQGALAAGIALGLLGVIGSLVAWGIGLWRSMRRAD